MVPKNMAIENKKEKHTREFGGGWVLPADQMDYLRRYPYEYHASAGSVLELLFLQRFWTWLIRYIPESIAPCVLTCSGLAINIACCLILVHFSPDARTEAPWWAFLLCAIGLFLYQTLDAMDGKQALKVQNTQIEEVYDHGCDAVSTILVVLAASIALQLGNVPSMMLILFLLSMLAFFSTHWQDHVTHIMVFGKIDVSEVQFCIITIHLITSLFGQQIWQFEILPNVELRYMLCAISVISVLQALTINIGYILGKKTPLDDFANIPRKQGSQIWNPIFPVLILIILTLKAYSSGLFAVNCIVFILTFGFAFAKLTTKLVMTNVSRGDMDRWDGCLVAPLLLCANAFLWLLPDHTALLCTLVYSVMDFARYFTYASWDLRDALDLWIFSLKYPPGHPHCRNGNLGYYVNGLNNAEIKEFAYKKQHYMSGAALASGITHGKACLSSYNH